MKAYSLDLRERIVQACFQGQSQSAVAARFGVCVRTVERYWQRHQKEENNGTLAPGKAPGQTRRLAAAQEPALLAMLAAQADWTLEAMAQEWENRTGVRLPCSTMHDDARCGATLGGAL